MLRGCANTARSTCSQSDERNKMRTVSRVLLTLATAIPGTLALQSGAQATVPEKSGLSITAATVVSGLVTNNGKAVPGADVRAEVWPSAEVLAKQPSGEKVDTRTAAEAVTDPDGNFAISVIPSSLSKNHVSANGSVDFTLIVADDKYQIRWNFTATRAKSGTPGLWGNPRIAPTLLAQRSRDGDAPTRLSIDIGNDAHVIEQGNEPAKWLGPDGQLLGAAKGLEAAKVARKPRTIGRQTVGSSVEECNAWGAMNEYQNGVSESFVRAVGSGNAPVTVDQEVGTEHTLGVAADDALGNWSQGGSLTLSFGAEAETAYPGYPKTILNDVNYRKYQMFCFFIWYYEWRPIGYFALNSGWAPISTPSWTSCTTYYSGKYTKVQGSNLTFSVGVGLSPVNVSAQAQFSNQTKLTWNVSGPAKLCGSNGFGWASAPEAGAYPA